jgi:hypothetical protein
MIVFLILTLYIFPLCAIYYCDMSSEIIQNIPYDNDNDFQHLNFIFFTKFHFTILRII